MTIVGMIYLLTIGPHPFNNSFIHRFTVSTFLSPVLLAIPFSFSPLFSSPHPPLFSPFVFSAPISSTPSASLNPSSPLPSFTLLLLIHLVSLSSRSMSACNSLVQPANPPFSFYLLSTSGSPLFPLTCSLHYHMLKHSHLILETLPSSSSLSSSSFSLALLSFEF